MITIVQGTNKKPVAGQRLADFFTRHNKYDGFLYIGYPIIGTAEGPYPIDALLVSEAKGLIAFSLIEGREIDVATVHDAQDDSFNKLESKLRAHKSLMKGRNLQVEIHPVTFAPAREDANDLSEDDYQICNEGNLEAWLDSCTWNDSSCYHQLTAVIQAISTIRKGTKKRIIQKENSRGAKLKKLEDSIANLDNLQGRAVIETVEGVQRIRGLAGSGKTIVLALKAAYLHAQHPDWKIAVTFHTRSLKGQFRRLINTFVIEQTNEEPDWDNLQILQSWGAPGGGDKNGMYYHFCQAHDITYYDYGTAKNKFGRDKEFLGVCDEAVSECTQPKSLYDVILVDEAQDFPPSFLHLCYEILTPEKRFVYAYDELQNLSSQSLPPPEEIFGKNENNEPRVQFSPNQAGKPQQDIILEKCYRNSRLLLVTAHALGFGIYRTPVPDIGTGLVQIFDHNELWIEVGYKVSKGQLDDGCDVVLERTEDSSPVFLEEHSPFDDLIQFQSFKNKEEQDLWVADQIKVNLNDDELRPDDIIVINPDPISTRNAVGSIRKILFEQGINSHLAGVDTSPDIFFDTGRESIAFTGIYRAKGNEAGMVYIINAQDCYSSYGGMAKVRNQLFTAITRSKAWVRVIGFGTDMDKLVKEFQGVQDHNYSLSFKYPTATQKEHLNIVNRDMTKEEHDRLLKNKDDLTVLLEDLEAERIFPEDFGADKLERLRRLLNKDLD